MARRERAMKALRLSTGPPLLDRNAGSAFSVNSASLGRPLTGQDFGGVCLHPANGFSASAIVS